MLPKIKGELLSQASEIWEWQQLKLAKFAKNRVSFTLYLPPQYEMIGPGSGMSGSSSAHLALAPRNYEMPTRPNVAYAAGVTPNVYEDYNI